MKVLGIASSPRRNGNTDRLLSEVLKGAASRGAEVKTIILKKLAIEPCRHCDGCLKAGHCVVNDDMQQVYEELKQADVIVLASPVQFMGVTAQLKAMIDRGQALWARKYRLKLPPLDSAPGQKRGFFISVGGTKLPHLFEPSLAIVKSFFLVLDISYAGELLFPGIDEKGEITKHPDALHQAFVTGQRLVEESMTDNP